MSRHDPYVRLGDMLDHAREALVFAQGKSRTDLDHDRLLTLALTRLLEVIGEAATGVPADVRSQHPQIPWSDIVGLRNRLIHGYHSVNLDLLWRVVTEDLPPLVAALEKVVPPEEEP